MLARRLGPVSGIVAVSPTRSGRCRSSSSPNASPEMSSPPSTTLYPASSSRSAAIIRPTTCCSPSGAQRSTVLSSRFAPRDGHRGARSTAEARSRWRAARLTARSLHAPSGRRSPHRGPHHVVVDQACREPGREGVPGHALGIVLVRCHQGLLECVGKPGEHGLQTVRLSHAVHAPPDRPGLVGPPACPPPPARRARRRRDSPRCGGSCAGPRYSPRADRSPCSEGVDGFVGSLV